MLLGARVWQFLHAKKALPVACGLNTSSKSFHHRKPTEAARHRGHPRAPFRQRPLIAMASAGEQVFEGKSTEELKSWLVILSLHSTL